jgi:hypothetical protein
LTVRSRARKTVAGRLHDRLVEGEIDLEMERWVVLGRHEPLEHVAKLPELFVCGPGRRQAQPFEIRASGGRR